MQEQPLQEDFKSYAFYQHIVDLPLNKFIEVSTTGNVSALVISGEPSEEELSSAWGRIMEQYGEAIGDHEATMRINLYKDIYRLQLKINQIALIVSLLRSYYVPKMVTELNRLLVSTLVFDVNKREEYDRRLQTALNKSKAFKIQLDMKVMQYESLKKGKDEEGGVSKEYFQSILITLSDHAKYPILDTIITVFEFCERIKRFNKVHRT